MNSVTFPSDEMGREVKTSSWQMNANKKLHKRGTIAIVATATTQDKVYFIRKLIFLCIDW